MELVKFLLCLSIVLLFWWMFSTKENMKTNWDNKNDGNMQTNWGNKNDGTMQTNWGGGGTCNSCLNLCMSNTNANTHFSHGSCMNRCAACNYH